MKKGTTVNLLTFSKLKPLVHSVLKYNEIESDVLIFSFINL